MRHVSGRMFAAGSSTTSSCCSSKEGTSPVTSEKWWPVKFRRRLSRVTGILSTAVPSRVDFNSSSRVQWRTWTSRALMIVAPVASQKVRPSHQESNWSNPWTSSLGRLALLPPQHHQASRFVCLCGLRRCIVELGQSGSCASHQAPSLDWGQVEDSQEVKLTPESTEMERNQKDQWIGYDHDKLKFSKRSWNW